MTVSRPPRFGTVVVVRCMSISCARPIAVRMAPWGVTADGPVGPPTAPHRPGPHPIVDRTQRGTSQPLRCARPVVRPDPDPRTIVRPRSARPSSGRHDVCPVGGKPRAGGAKNAIRSSGPGAVRRAPGRRSGSSWPSRRRSSRPVRSCSTRSSTRAAARRRPTSTSTSCMTTAPARVVPTSGSRSAVRRIACTDDPGPHHWRTGVGYHERWEASLPVGTHAVTFKAENSDHEVVTLAAGTITISPPATPTPKPTPTPVATPAPTPTPTPTPTPPPTEKPTPKPRAQADPDPRAARPHCAEADAPAQAQAPGQACGQARSDQGRRGARRRAVESERGARDAGTDAHAVRIAGRRGRRRPGPRGRR